MGPTNRPPTIGRPMNKYNIIFGPSAPEKRAKAPELRRAMTPAERLLWQRLRAGRLAGLHFRRQQVIDGYIVDFYCHAVGLVVECDGGVHEGPEQDAEDGERERALGARGLRVLRFPNERVLGDVEAVLGEIETAAMLRAP